MGDELTHETLYDKLKIKLVEFIERENPKMLPSEKELIKRYGVSRNTVRRAIQDLGNDGVLKTVQGIGTLVLSPADKMGKGMILVIRAKKMFPFQQDVLDELLSSLNYYRLNSLLIVMERDKPDMERLDFLISKSDGIIIDQVTSFSKKICDKLLASKKPSVCLRWRQDDIPMPFVAEDVEAGFHMVAKHLIELGHRRIAYLGNTDDRDRMSGITKAFAEAGLSLDPSLCVDFTCGSRREGYDAALELLRRKIPFSAVMVMNDDSALGVMESLMIAGIKIPEQVSITGFDNIKGSDEFPVPLTTCGVPLPQLVNEAIGMLLNRSVRQPDGKHIIPELVRRESTARIAI